MTLKESADRQTIPEKLNEFKQNFAFTYFQPEVWEILNLCKPTVKRKTNLLIIEILSFTKFQLIQMIQLRNYVAAQTSYCNCENGRFIF